jgi:hypothetical protein
MMPWRWSGSGWITSRREATGPAFFGNPALGFSIGTSLWNRSSAAQESSVTPQSLVFFGFNLGGSQGNRKVDEAVKILLTAYSGVERLTMKSGFFETAPVGS